jgi:hypothetical protein
MEDIDSTCIHCLCRWIIENKFCFNFSNQQDHNAIPTQSNVLHLPRAPYAHSMHTGNPISCIVPANFHLHRTQKQVRYYMQVSSK